MEKFILLKSKDSPRIITYGILFIVNPFVLYQINANITIIILIQLVYIIIIYSILLNVYNDFYFYSKKVRIINKLKFWSPNIEYFYVDIEKIIVNNISVFIVEKKIKIILKDSRKKRFGYSGLNEAKLKKIVKKFEEGGFNIEYYE